MLVDLIIDKVKEISNGKHIAKKGHVVDFLKRLKEQRPKEPTKREADIDRETGPQEKVKYRYKLNGQIHPAKYGKDVYVQALDYVFVKYDRFKEIKLQKFNKSGNLGTRYQMSEQPDEVVMEMKHKTQLSESRIWVNTCLSADGKRAKLISVGKFYQQFEGRKILGEWGSGAEVEFDIPTKTSD